MNKAIMCSNETCFSLCITEDEKAAQLCDSCLYYDALHTGASHFDKPHIFDAIKWGVQPSGTYIDIAYGSADMGERLGIEPFVGVTGFTDKDHFLRELQAMTGSNLTDWHVVRVPLFRCWFSQVYEKPTVGSLSNCYYAWRVFDTDPYAIKTEQVEVYALRHKSWKASCIHNSLPYWCARNRSCAEALWYKTNDAVPDPEIMEGYDAGFFLAGKAPNSSKDDVSIRLTWPEPDFFSAFDRISQFAEQGYTKVTLYGGDVGFCIENLSEKQIEALKDSYREHGNDAEMIDMAMVAGLIDMPTITFSSNPSITLKAN